jgi:hypothetical protein
MMLEAFFSKCPAMGPYPRFLDAKKACVILYMLRDGGRNDGRCEMNNKSARGDSRNTLDFARSLKKLSDNDLLIRLKKCRGAERAVLLKILRYLNEIERRRLYVPRGYSSLYDFCTDYLRYSRSAAMRRIHAARCIARFPQVVALLRTGEVTLTVAAMISRILTTENAEEIISYVRGRSTRDVEMLVAGHRLELMLRDRVRQVCLIVPDVDENNSSRFPGAGKNFNQVIDNEPHKNRGMNAGACGVESDDHASAGGPPTTGPGVVTDTTGCAPKSEEIERVLITQRYRIEFTAGLAFMEKLNRIKSLHSTKHPGGLSLEEVFDITMTEYLDRYSPEKRMKKRNSRRGRKERKNAPPVNKNQKGTGQNRKDLREMKQTGKDRRDINQTGAAHRSTGRNPTKRTRHIPQEIRDEVFARDGGRCTFTGDDGKRCSSDWNLQIDHIVPFAKGGDNSPENLRLLCPVHNRLAAEQAYGKTHMDTFYGKNK